jgi:hypothetical protein
MMEKNIEKTVTINAPKGGCFLFSVQDYQWIAGQNTYFRRYTLENGMGKNHDDTPGIGINFKQLKANQREELIDKYSLWYFNIFVLITIDGV